MTAEKSHMLKLVKALKHALFVVLFLVAFVCFLVLALHYARICDWCFWASVLGMIWTFIKATVEARRAVKNLEELECELEKSEG